MGEEEIEEKENAIFQKQKKEKENLIANYTENQQIIDYGEGIEKEKKNCRMNMNREICFEKSEENTDNMTECDNEVQEEERKKNKKYGVNKESSHNIYYANLNHSN